MYVRIENFPEANEERKIEVVVHDFDVYSADQTLAIVILPVLRKLKEANAGAPFVRNEDVPKELQRPNDVEDHEIDDNWYDRWRYVLDEMIWSLEQVLDDWESRFYSGEVDMSFNEKTHDDEGNPLAEFVLGPNHTFVFDEKGYAEYEKRIDRGLTLFGRYFRALWT